VCLPCFRFSEMVSLIVVVRDIVGAREIVCVCVCCGFWFCCLVSDAVQVHGKSVDVCGDCLCV
jgi:hypothetical protein